MKMTWDPNSNEEKRKRLAWQIAVESVSQNKGEFLDVYERLIKSFNVDPGDESYKTI